MKRIIVASVVLLSVSVFVLGQTRGDGPIPGWEVFAGKWVYQISENVGYVFTIYALDITLDLETINKEAIMAAMEGHILAQSALLGYYTSP